MSFQHTVNATNINVSAEVIFPCPLLIYIGIPGNIKNQKGSKNLDIVKVKMHPARNLFQCYWGMRLSGEKSCRDMTLLEFNMGQMWTVRQMMKCHGHARTYDSFLKQKWFFLQLLILMTNRIVPFPHISIFKQL